jgi:glycosyltransferase involved in cell wall biosynthesis
MEASLRVAVVHDWLYVHGGAERVLRSILRSFPGADLFTLFDVLSDEDRARIGYTKARTSFLQRMPGIAKRHRLYLPLMPLAIEQFDLTSYDVVISSSYAVAKGVLTGPDQLHVSYVHSPMRYAWDLQHKYLAESHHDRGIKGALARLLLHKMRLWDTRTAHGVDAYAANSHFVARRIRKAYGRTAEVIHPPVDVPAILPSLPRERFYLTASRLVPYKQVRAIVEAFRELPDEQLIVVGDGPERERIAAVAGPNVVLRGHVPDAELRRLMSTARAFIFAAEEDFGIVPVEAQGVGTPVIALGRGGARETVIAEGPRRTGLFFDHPEPAEIAAAIRRFADQPGAFSPFACHENARRFSEARFERALRGFVEQQRARLDSEIDTTRARAPATIGAAAA